MFGKIGHLGGLKDIEMVVDISRVAVCDRHLMNISLPPHLMLEAAFTMPQMPIANPGCYAYISVAYVAFKGPISHAPTETVQPQAWHATASTRSHGKAPTSICQELLFSLARPKSQKDGMIHV